MIELKFVSTIRLESLSRFKIISSFIAAPILKKLLKYFLSESEEFKLFP